MRDILHKLLKALKFNRRDWAVFLLALLLAFSIWLIHNLSLRYNDYLKVAVTAVCNIDGHSDVSENRCEVMARCRTTGYKLIRYNLIFRNRTVEVQFNPSVMKHKSDDTFYVTSSDLQEYSHLIFGDKVTVEYFVSDTLFFRFPEQNNKRVPVYLVHSLSFRPQYINSSEFVCEPDSITIYGDKFKIDKIDKVFTEPVRYSDLHENIQGLVSIDEIRGVRFSDSEVRYSMDVTRYVEVSRTYQIYPVNVPADKKLQVYPSYLEAVFKCRYPGTADAIENLSFVVDYNDFVSSLSGKCPVKSSALPDEILFCDITPVAVDCVLEDR